MTNYKYLIVGGGMTADAAVEGIRQIDDSGSIGIISIEPDAPYKRPPLTKSLWTKGKSLEDIGLDTQAKGAELILNTRITELDPDQKEVRDEHGNVYRYDKLLIATGGSPNHLSIGGERVLYYRTANDYRQLRDLTTAGQYFAVLGGAFIGSEIAAALRINKKKVTMIFPEGGVLGRILPPHLADEITAYYENKGITVVPSRKPSGIEFDDEVCTVHIENGHAFSVDGVVAGIGITPNTQLAEAAGLEVDNGIVVDEQLRTKYADVFASGDVANFYNPALDRRLRVEHEDNALTMGKLAGRNMAGEKQPYHHLPFFYSDLFDLGYEAVGDTDPAKYEVITEVDHPEQKGCLFYVQDGRVRGIVLWNLFDKVPDARELIASPGPHSNEALKVWSRERAS